MKKLILICMLALLLCLSGCFRWMDGYYYTVTPYQEQTPHGTQQMLSAGSYAELLQALVDMVEIGRESALISVSQMEKDHVVPYMERAMDYVKGTHPIGAYAVDVITYELGTSSGQSALAVDIQYIHNMTDIRRIARCDGMEAAENCIVKALNNCEAGVVLLVEGFRDTDLTQLVQDYADNNPDYVMELPEVTVNIYPEKGLDRVVELKFSYQTSREVLRDMQSRVLPLFAAAKLYVTGETGQGEKYAQLYAFLMERTTYDIQTSITPAYSLLHHSVGDSKAFAVVYASMCRRAELECMVVSGTMDGEPRFWNIICQDGVYYHLDLLRSNEAGKFMPQTDADMQSYVWDYSAYPVCGAESVQERTESAE
jgi:hypothetical protein